ASVRFLGWVVVAIAAVSPSGLELLVLVDLAAHLVEGAVPELPRADVDPEARREVRRLAEARRREELLVVRHERRAALPVDRVEAEPEEQPERVRVVVE